jgi:hypothetical protein
VAIQLGAAVAEADFAWLVGSICQINRIPFDPALLLQRFPAPHSVRQFPIRILDEIWTINKVSEKNQNTMSSR